MTTLTKTYNPSHSNAQTDHSATFYARLIKKLEFSYFGLIALSILISSCLGGITTMQIFEHDAPLIEFILSVSFTMAVLVACLSQAPAKWIVNLFTLSILVNTVLLIINLI
ncbi:hypothetical protein CNR22_18760 [Sphingobacteriaceae bacterium]|nr:hypothetical protein CNR22_18760 [Sphingobacteriaceae bacterium]